MTFLSARSRMTIGLASLLVSVLCTAMAIGLVPERDSAVLAGRADLCEAIAVCSSDYISRDEVRRLEMLLKTVVERNDAVLSAGIRRASGELVAAMGDHASQWEQETGERSSPTQVQVPIRSGREKWGSVELRFRPLGQAGIAGWLANPWVQMVLFITGTSYVLFYFYLSKMLRHLDPSKTVPRRVRAALDSLAEGLLVVDHDQRIVLANQSFATWVGRRPEQLIGLRAAKLNWVKNERGEALTQYPWAEAIRLETPQAGVMLGLARKDEPLRTLIANASPVLGHDGKYRGVLVSFDDVTQLEETKRNLTAATKVAEEANRAKSDFLARMSHEIRTPMNAILGYTDVLRRGFDESIQDRQEYLDTIHASGEHLLALINDILDLSKIEAGRMTLERVRCSPYKLIHQVVSVLRGKAEEKGLTLDFECDGLLPETILTDAVRLRQAIMNLAGNAIKFTDQGGVRIVTRLVARRAAGSNAKAGTKRDSVIPAESAFDETAADDGLLAIEVRDTGIGISPEGQQRIFDPFVQADVSITRRYGGTGLGLAISRQLAEALDGGIRVQSELGTGTTFALTVGTGPLAGIPLMDAASAQANLTRAAAEPRATIHLPPSRILVADDGDTNRRLVKLVLGRAGADVVAVDNGQQAVEHARREPFDVILMDMQMPVMDGYTATRTLRADGCTLPIIALTAHAMQGDEAKCRAAGCSGFLTKPINIDLLLSTLAETLSVRGSRPEAADPAGAAATLTPSTDVPSTDASNAGRNNFADSGANGQGVGCTNFSFRGPGIDSIGKGDPPQKLKFVHPTPALDERDREVASACVATEAATDDLRGFQRQLEDLKQLVLEATQAEPVECDTQTPRPLAATDGTDLRRELAGEGNPIHCALPTDDPDFREIAEEFVNRLRERLAVIRDAQATGDLVQVARFAHWLRGSGGTAGFDCFTEPARELETVAKLNDQHRSEALVDQLVDMTARIDLATVPAS